MPKNFSNLLTCLAAIPRCQSLVTEKDIKKSNKKQESLIDNWGAKLPLIGIARKEFLLTLVQLETDEQKTLKELLNQADENRSYLSNFFTFNFHLQFLPLLLI